MAWKGEGGKAGIILSSFLLLWALQFSWTLWENKRRQNKTKQNLELSTPGMEVSKISVFGHLKTALCRIFYACTYMLAHESNLMSSFPGSNILVNHKRHKILNTGEIVEQDTVPSDTTDRRQWLTFIISLHHHPVYTSFKVRTSTDMVPQILSPRVWESLFQSAFAELFCLQ